MITRALFKTAEQYLKGFPVLVITGPRQSGKTTLAKVLAKGRPYASLEDPDTRDFADNDARGFLSQFPDGAVLDEIQRCPKLFSYLQGLVDKDHRQGLFILTGSQQFGLIETVSQSLAGRAALLQLLPFSLPELQAAGKEPETLNELLFKGLFPPIYDRPVSPSAWLSSYIATYLERDVKQVLKIKDLSTFQRFVALCAGRVGQLLNISSLAADTGISRATAEAWLSALEASYLVFLVRPYFGNLSKRLIKSPKLYFCDPGLAAWLMGIRELGHLSVHPLRGALMENWVMSECAKQQATQGESPRLHFWRDKEGNEVDIIIEQGERLHAIEVKAGQTLASDVFSNLITFQKQYPNKAITNWLVYGGSQMQQRTLATVIPWSKIGQLSLL